jgi:ribosomal protein S18 acetylase RimI-like enzyme
MEFLDAYKDDENTFVLYSDAPVFSSALTAEYKPNAYNLKDNASFIHQGKVEDGQGKTYIHIFSVKPEYRGQEIDLSSENVEHIETVPNPVLQDDDGAV